MKAAAKRRAAVGPFSPPGIARRFEHADGSWYRLQVVDCRVYESWSTRGNRGTANTSTRDDDDDANAFALAEQRALAKKGFVEVAPQPGIAFDSMADVVDTIRKDVDYQGKPRSDFQPSPEWTGVYSTRSLTVAQWLLTSEDRRLAIRLHTVVRESALPEETRQSMARQLIGFLHERRDEILADRRTPLRKLALPARVGAFTHLVVMSPVATNFTISQNVSFANLALARSVWRAFPAFECEVSAADTVSVAEARTSGNGRSLRYAAWDRDPHPVFDLAYRKTTKDAGKFLVFDPRELERRLGASALATLKDAEVCARNHAGEVRRFVRGDAPDLGELRQFFGY